CRHCPPGQTARPGRPKRAMMDGTRKDGEIDSKLADASAPKTLRDGDRAEERTADARGRTRREPGDPLFGRNDMVSGGYRVVRLLGHGGMGEVYEARDLELRANVALKVRRNWGDANALERFKREVHLARQVTHPNVCRIYDVGYHRVGAEQDTV